MKLFKRYKAIVYLPNLYGVFQYLLLESSEKNDTLFFIHSKFPAKVSSRMKNTVYVCNAPVKKHLFSLLKIHYYALIYRNIPVFLGGDLVYSDLFLSRFKNIFYMEDGVGSYVLVNNEAKQVFHKRKSALRRFVSGDIHPKMGLADNVRKIYLTGILPLPAMIAGKVEIINLKQLWQKKTPAQQQEIKRLFIPPDFDCRRINEYEVLLLTQPFSEQSDGHFSEEEKIEVYRKLLKGIDKSKVIIKPHPVETTDYRHYFPNIFILDICCPFELLLFLGFNVKNAISVSSTAIFNLDNSIGKTISGHDVTPALAAETKRRGFYTIKLKTLL